MTEQQQGAFELPFGAFELTVQTLAAAADDKLRLHALSRTEAHFVLERPLGAVHIAVLRYRDDTALEVGTRLGALAKAAKATPMDLVLVGGDQAARKLLKKAVPPFTKVRVGLLHLPDQGEPWSLKPTAAGKLLLPFDERSEGVASGPEEWAGLSQLIEVSRADSDSKRMELATFQRMVGDRKPIATWTVAVAIGLVFGLQLLLGGTESPPVLVRMGALMPDKIVAGEVWRLLSCTFLHGGFMHVALNVYVLIILGQFLERIIGPARFVVLYVVSAIAGSIGSALLLDAQMSVGASGAVWGLLGAHAVLAFRPQGLLPTALIPGAKKAAMINLGINVLNSFRPLVDMWAHFAGGLGGAALLITGLITRGLPKMGELEKQGEGNHTHIPPQVPTSTAWWAAAALAAVVLLAGPATGLVMGDAIALKQPLELTTTTLDELGVTLDLPVELDITRTEFEGGLEITYGEVIADPIVVSVLTVPMPPLDQAGLMAQLTGLKQELVPPEGSEVLAEPAGFSRGPDMGITASYTYPSTLVYERAFLYMEGQLIRVDVMRWPAHPEAAPAGSAQAIVETARIF